MDEADQALISGALAFRHSLRGAHQTVIEHLSDQAVAQKIRQSPKICRLFVT